jgi:hypothetical protein
MRHHGVVRSWAQGQLYVLLYFKSPWLLAGQLGFDFRQVLGIFIFATASRPALGPTQFPIQWVPDALSPWIKRRGLEADHSFLSSVEVKNAWSYTSTRQYVFILWYLVKRRDNFTLPYNVGCGL